MEMILCAEIFIIVFYDNILLIISLNLKFQYPDKNLLSNKVAFVYYYFVHLQHSCKCSNF